MSATEQPQGRSIKELRAIVQASLDRLRRIEDVWNDLTDDQQERLASTVEAMAAGAEWAS